MANHLPKQKSQLRVITQSSRSTSNSVVRRIQADMVMWFSLAYRQVAMNWTTSSKYSLGRIMSSSASRLLACTKFKIVNQPLPVVSETRGTERAKWCVSIATDQGQMYDGNNHISLCISREIYLYLLQLLSVECRLHIYSNKKKIFTLVCKKKQRRENTDNWRQREAGKQARGGKSEALKSFWTVKSTEKDVCMAAIFIVISPWVGDRIGRTQPYVTLYQVLDKETTVWRICNVCKYVPFTGHKIWNLFEKCEKLIVSCTIGAFTFHLKRYVLVSYISEWLV